MAFHRCGEGKVNRFFIDKRDIIDGVTTVSGDDVRHIKKVLRLDRGDLIELCDGEGFEYSARIASFEDDGVKCSIISKNISLREPKCSITLFQGLPKAGKLEEIVQKAVELGAVSVTPFSAARSVVQLKAKEFEPRKERLMRVAYEAAKQSKRGIIPSVGSLTRLADIDLSPFDLVLLPYEEERETTLKAALRGRKCSNIAVFIGPEGGFEANEVELLTGRGALSVTLGPRILRTETAGPAVIAMTLYELEGAQ